VSYNVFSVKLAKSGFDDGYFILGFFCLREALERNRQSCKSEFEKHVRSTSLKHSAITSEELMSYDVMAAAKWAFVRGPEMYRLENTPFGKSWEMSSAVQTDFWDGEPGLSRKRWLLWQDRFNHIADQACVRKEVRTLSKEASAAIGRFTLE
jgi:hypothetical protein